jgi:hypothetical protein
MKIKEAPAVSDGLCAFLHCAAEEVARGCSTVRFMELRYDELNRRFPHPPFSTQEAENAFFAKTLAYVSGAEEIPLSTNDDRPYRSNYLEWCRAQAPKTPEERWRVRVELHGQLAAKAISEYLTFGMHHSTIDGQAAIVALVKDAVAALYHKSQERA